MKSLLRVKPNCIATHIRSVRSRDLPTTINHFGCKIKADGLNGCCAATANFVDFSSANAGTEIFLFGKVHSGKEEE